MSAVELLRSYFDRLETAQREDLFEDIHRATKQRGDLLQLGARTWEGLSLMVDSRKKKLVASGPLPVA